MLADLHTHTTFSDGVLAPDELIRLAEERSLSAIAITDHDTVEGVQVAMDATEGNNIRVIAGIECSCTENERETHLLGLFIDHTNSTLLEYTEHFRKERLRRVERIIEKLHAININISFDNVMKSAEDGTVGRLHVARELVSMGQCKSIKDAFYRFLNPKQPAYQEKWEFSVCEGIELIHTAGGAAVLAHPGQNFATLDINKMLACKLDGIEVWHPSHPKRLERYYEQFTRDNRRFASGGSDFHGNRFFDDHNFGTYGVSINNVEEFCPHTDRTKFATSTNSSSVSE